MTDAPLKDCCGWPSCRAELGNIEFEEIVSEGEEGSKVANQDQGRKVSGLLDVPFEKLETALTIKPGKLFHRKLDVKLAEASRNSLCMYIYQLAFEWFVETINQGIARSESDVFCTVGILAVFGLENFDAKGQSNRLSQLCINLANERLHQLFIGCFFEAEQVVYEAEDIEWTVQEYESSLPVIHLITKTNGIFAILHASGESASDSGSKADEAFLNSMDEAFKKVTTTGKFARRVSDARVDLLAIYCHHTLKPTLGHSIGRASKGHL